MKSFKFLGTTVATLGIAASVGGAIALHIGNASDIGFGIGAGSYSGSSGKVTYKINGNTSGNVAPKYYSLTDVEGAGLTEEFCQVKYTFPLSATYSSDLVEQTYVHGHLGVSITNIPSQYQGKLTIWAGIEGYGETYARGEYLYHDTFGGDVNITSEQQEYVKGRDVSVVAAGVQSLVIWMKYTALSGSDYIALDEAALGYTLSVTWGQATEDVGYVVGTGNQWTVDQDFAMAVNIAASKTEWIYEGLVADASWSEGKCRTGEGTWSADPNATLTAGKTYNVYWEGNSDAQAYFVEQ